ncbi:hypothetical protein D3C73_677970 [compost metagenome]
MLFKLLVVDVPQLTVDQQHPRINLAIKTDMLTLTLQLKLLKLKPLQNPVQQDSELFGPLHEPFLQALDHDFAAPDDHAAALGGKLGSGFQQALDALYSCTCCLLHSRTSGSDAVFYGFSGFVQPFANRLEPELHRQLNQSHGKCGGERDGRRLDHLLPALAQVGANITRGLDQGLGDGFDRICLQVQGDQVHNHWKGGSDCPACDNLGSDDASQYPRDGRQKLQSITLHPFYYIRFYLVKQHFRIAGTKLRAVGDFAAKALLRLSGIKIRQDAVHRSRLAAAWKLLRFSILKVRFLHQRRVQLPFFHRLHFDVVCS